MSAPNPVGISSQDARVELDADATPEDIAKEVNDALTLMRDDIQRLAGTVTKSVTYHMSTIGVRLPVTATGIARVWAISDTATASSDGSNYHVLTLTRNGITVGSMTYDTRNTEIPAYQGGCYLGEVSVGERDVIAVSIAVTGSPSPALSSDNFCLYSIVRGR